MRSIGHHREEPAELYRPDQFVAEGSASPYSEAITPIEPRHVVIIENPGATNAEAGRGRLESLYSDEARWANRNWLKTSDEDLDDQFDQHVVSHSDIIISGGDGTARWMLEKLRKRKDLEDVRIVLVGAGNKNDLATMLNGEEHAADPEYVLDNGHYFDLYPIEGTFDKGGKNERKVTAFYVLSIGASAVISYLVDTPHYRERHKHHTKRQRKMAEYLQSAKGIATAKPFRMTGLHAAPVTGWWQNRRNRTADVILAGGDRVAGGEIRMPAHPDDPVGFAERTTGSSLTRKLGGLVMLKLGLSRVRHQPYMRLLLDPAPAGADGQNLGDMPPGIFTAERGEAVRGLWALRNARALGNVILATDEV